MDSNPNLPTSEEKPPLKEGVLLDKEADSDAQDKFNSFHHSQQSFSKIHVFRFGDATHPKRNPPGPVGLFLSVLFPILGVAAIAIFGGIIAVIGAAIGAGIFGLFLTRRLWRSLTGRH